MANVRVYGATRQSASRAGSPMLTGVLLGAVLVIAWVALVWVTHNGVGLSAWGVGALLGVVVAKVARPPGKATGMLAAVLTIGTVLLAKVCVVVFALQPILHDELARNQETITALYMVEMTKSRSFSPALQADLESHPAVVRDTGLFGAGYELRYRMISEAQTRAREASRPERERLVRVHLDRFISKLGFWVLFAATFRLLDLLWIGLGVSTAWKLGQGIG